MVTRGNDRFAVFGGIAYQLLPFDFVHEGDVRFDYIPAIVNGRMLYECPDEGKSGILYLYRKTKNGIPGEWFTSFSSAAGWLWTNELELTNEQIEDIIVDEIDSGMNVITRKPAGWA